MLGVCIYCLKWTNEPARACKLQGNGKDYGHDYSYDEDYIAAVRDYQENLGHEVLPL